MTKVDDSVANYRDLRTILWFLSDLLENLIRIDNPVRLFCTWGAYGKASCVEQLGCNCPKCGVHSRNKLTGDYYCRVDHSIRVPGSRTLSS